MPSAAAAIFRKPSRTYTLSENTNLVFTTITLPTTRWFGSLRILSTNSIPTRKQNHSFLDIFIRQSEAQWFNLQTLSDNISLSHDSTSETYLNNQSFHVQANEAVSSRKPELHEVVTRMKELCQKQKHSLELPVTTVYGSGLDKFFLKEIHKTKWAPRAHPRCTKRTLPQATTKTGKCSFGLAWR